MHVITGTLAYDYIMAFPGAYEDHILPDQIHKINLSFLVNTFEKRRGGTAGNVSYSLALLKTPHVLFSYAGKDFDDYRKSFEKNGIDLSNVKIDKNDYTSTGFAMTDKSHNQIWGFFIGASKNIPSLNLKKVAGKGDTVLIGPSGAAGSMSFVDQCIDNNISYIFDPGFILTEVNNRDLTKGVKHCDILIGNDYEIELISTRVKDYEEIVEKITVIKTLGKNGVEISERGMKYLVKPATVKKAIDPTGAGDAFRAGLIAGREKGLSIKEAAQMGSIAAAYAVESYGTQEHAYTIAEFKNRYKRTYNNVIQI